MGNWGKRLMSRSVLALRAGQGRWVRAAALSHSKRGTGHLILFSHPFLKLDMRRTELLQVLQFSDLIWPDRWRSSCVPFLPGVPAVKGPTVKEGTELRSGMKMKFLDTPVKFQCPILETLGSSGTTFLLSSTVNVSWGVSVSSPTASFLWITQSWAQWPPHPRPHRVVRSPRWGQDHLLKSRFTQIIILINGSSLHVD